MLTLELFIYHRYCKCPNPEYRIQPSIPCLRGMSVDKPNANQLYGTLTKPQSSEDLMVTQDHTHNSLWQAKQLVFLL